MLCAPFTLHLYSTMVLQSVALVAIAGEAGLRDGYTRQSLSELRAESELLWLIQVGVLRREVDGQGLTDSFRVTPLGRQRVQQWQMSGQPIPSPTLRDRFYNASNRWLRLPL